MTVYADDRYYSVNYRGDTARLIPIELFDIYARKASAYINQYTFGNIGENVSDAVRSCCCELAEAIYQLDSGAAAQGVVSEKVGDISRSYESGEARRQSLPATVRSIVYSWLADTGLLFRGGRLC